jgi:hypothetical protein
MRLDGMQWWLEIYRYYGGNPRTILPWPRTEVCKPTFDAHADPEAMASLVGKMGP